MAKIIIICIVIGVPLLIGACIVSVLLIRRDIEIWEIIQEHKEQKKRKKK